MFTAVGVLVLLARAVDVPLPERFDGHQPLGCLTSQSVDDHLWYTTVMVTFPEPNPETGRDGVWKHYNYWISDTKEKGEKACNKWLDAVHKRVREAKK